MNKVPKKAVWRQIIALIPVYMNVLMMGCALGWLPYATYFMLAGEEVSGTLFQCTLMASFYEVGRIVFAIPAGILTDKYGRKKITISAAILYFFGWLGHSLNTSIIMMYIARFVIGLATSLNNATALISIGETASPEIRGRLTGISQVFLRAGIISVSIAVVIFSSYTALVRCVTILCVMSLLSMYWMAETPSFLIAISKPEQAKSNLRRIRQGYEENQINEEFEKLQKYIEDERTHKSQLSWKSFLKTKTIRKPLFIGVLLNFLVVLTGGTLFAYYITSILPANDHIPKIYYPFILQTFLFLISFSLPLYIDKLPRRILFLFGVATMTAINAICALAKYFLVVNETMPIFEWIFGIGNFLSGVCNTMIILPMNSAINSELYPQAVKGFCGSLAIISHAFAGMILNQMYSLFEFYSSLYYMYFIFSIYSLILYLIIYFLLPEGSGVALPDIQKKFRNKPTPCDDVKIEKESQK